MTDVFDSPMSVSAYEVLRVDVDVDDEGLRRAYRVRLRETHPDTGVRRRPLRPGAARVGARRYARGPRRLRPRSRTRVGRVGRRGCGIPSSPSRQPGPAPARTATRRMAPRAVPVADPRVGGARCRRRRPVRPGVGCGRHRRRSGTSSPMRSPRRRPRAWSPTSAWVHRLARRLRRPRRTRPEQKIDHLVLGPSGLYAMLSEDFGGPVGVRRGEISGPNVLGSPVTQLVSRARVIARAAGVRFSGAKVVLPDDAILDAVTDLGKVRGTPVVLVQRSALTTLLRRGIPGARESAAPSCSTSAPGCSNASGTSDAGVGPGPPPPPGPAAGRHPAGAGIRPRRRLGLRCPRCPTREHPRRRPEPSRHPVSVGGRTARGGPDLPRVGA